MQPSNMGQKIWLVGGTSGIGLSLCERWLAAGKQVVVSGRGAAESPLLIALKQQYDSQLYLLDLDVTSSAEMLAPIVDSAWQAFDGLDSWMYNAGIYQHLKQSQWQAENFEQIAQVNYLGATRLMTLLAPYFTQQGHGKWLWNISLAADFGLPYGSAYSAPKAALLNLAQSIRPEMQAKGIVVQVINHGFVKTRLTAQNSFTMPGLMTVEAAAEKIDEQSQAHNRFEIRFPFGLALVLKLLKILPYRLSLAITHKMLES